MASMDLLQLSLGGGAMYVAVKAIDALKARRNGNGNGHSILTGIDVRDDMRAVLSEMLLPIARDQLTATRELTTAMRDLKGGLGELVQRERERATAAAAAAAARSGGTERWPG